MEQEVFEHTAVARQAAAHVAKVQFVQPAMPAARRSEAVRSQPASQPCMYVQRSSQAATSKYEEKRTMMIIQRKYEI